LAEGREKKIWMLKKDIVGFCGGMSLMVASKNL
jgi:hypothetical protein